MILIVTHKADFTADFVIEKLNARGIKYYRLNCEDLNMTDYNFLLNGEARFSLGKGYNYSSVWFRRTMLPNLPEGLKQAEKNFILESYRNLLDNSFTLIDAKWLSYPENIYKSENKLFQLKLAKELGFNVPKTLVTNDPQAVTAFFIDCNENVIIKPIHSGRIESGLETQLLFANKLKKEHLLDLSQFDLTPCIFQEFIEKEMDIRITIVGDKVFSAFVDSQADPETKIDWRRKKTRFKKFKLPESLETQCIELTKRLGLSFGAIDIVKSIQGDYFFLEINPNGQWAWIEIDTGLPISDEIIGFLN